MVGATAGPPAESVGVLGDPVVAFVCDGIAPSIPYHARCHVIDA